MTRSSEQSGSSSHSKSDRVHIFWSRQHLKASLDIASASQDNYLRALILALTSSRYLHTASEHAKKMLETCRQLAAGLGARAISDDHPDDGLPRPPGITESLGNAPLGLWVGEQFLGASLQSGNQNCTPQVLILHACHRVEPASRTIRQSAETSTSQRSPSGRSSCITNARK